jgi:ribonuclease D
VKNNTDTVPIEIIDTEKKLVKIVEHLKLLADIFIDTEFDDFNTQYGLHLQLIQIFDGTSCFLIDPLQIKNLHILWEVFENKNICKVLYSGANDVAVLKKYNCNTRNIFDIQVAALLCNRTANSYSDLIRAEFGVEINKSQQRSKWDNRPLTASQLTYACNDVIYLHRLKEIFLQEINKMGILHILEEENVLIEAAFKKKYEPKLKPIQKRIFNSYAKAKLMEFKGLINSYAKLLNVPLHYIVQDSLLEEIIKDKTKFLANPFLTGFYKDVLNDDLFKKQFLEIVDSIDRNKGWVNVAKEKLSEKNVLSNTDTVVNISFLSFKQYVINRYGEVAGTSMLKGLSKKISDGVIEWEGTPQYQRDLYNDFLASS